jgi:hypothetical protein
VTTQIEEEIGINIKESENRHHVAIRSGSSSRSRKYSDAAVDLLKKVQDNEEYTLDLQPTPDVEEVAVDTPETE